MDSGISDLDDVGMPEASERHSLPAEALESGGGQRAGGPQKLNYEGLLQINMDRAVDAPDGTFAEALLKTVLPVYEAPGG